MTYDASSIQIKQKVDFIFGQIEHISKKYNKPESFVKRVIESCYLYGYGADYFISVYCEKDGKFPRDPYFSKFHGERLKHIDIQAGVKK